MSTAGPGYPRCRSTTERGNHRWTDLPTRAAGDGHGSGAAHGTPGHRTAQDVGTAQRRTDGGKLDRLQGHRLRPLRRRPRGPRHPDPRRQLRRRQHRPQHRLHAAHRRRAQRRLRARTDEGRPRTPRRRRRVHRPAAHRLHRGAPRAERRGRPRRPVDHLGVHPASYTCGRGGLHGGPGPVLPPADILLRAVHPARASPQRPRQVRGDDVDPGPQQPRGHRRVRALPRPLTQRRQGLHLRRDPALRHRHHRGHRRPGPRPAPVPALRRISGGARASTGAAAASPAPCATRGGWSCWSSPTSSPTGS